MRGDIEDGWGSRAGRVAASPLRLARKCARSTSPACFAAEGGQGQSHAHRLMVRSMAQPCVRRTMGFEPDRISIALALELKGTQLCEAFDVVAEGDEGLDAADEVRQRLRARGRVERTRGGAEADPGDGAGARGDGEVDGGFVVFRDCFDMGAVGVVFGEGCEGVGVAHAFGEIGDDLARGFHDLPDRIVGEEIRKQKPEPLHTEQCTRTRSPADSNELPPTNSRGRGLKCRAIFFGFPPDLQRLFPRVSCPNGVIPAGVRSTQSRDPS